MSPLTLNVPVLETLTEVRVSDLIPPKPPHVFSLHLSASPAGGVTATGFPFRHPEWHGRYLAVMNAALGEFEDLRRVGAASLDLAHCAAGVWSGFFELGLGLWDIAAGALLVREAGGVVTDWAGDGSAVFVSGDILAGGPEWHRRMLQLVRRVEGR